MDNSYHDVRLKRLLEREKELNCLYKIESLLIDDHRKLEYILSELVNAIPPGWQYPSVCECSITVDGEEYSTEDFIATEYIQSADIIVGDHVEGKIEIVYTHLIRLHHGNAFLEEEQKLLNIIASSLGKTIFRRKLKSTLDYLKSSPEKKKEGFTDDMILNPDSDQHWRWRNTIAEKIADHLDLDRFGLMGLYLIGSTKNATAGPGSDIDFIAHSNGNPDQIADLKLWIQGWGLCLSEMNLMKSGYHSSGSLIDLHIITDEDIKNKDSYAIMLTAVSDRARPIKVKN